MWLNCKQNVNTIIIMNILNNDFIKIVIILGGYRKKKGWVRGVDREWGV